MAKAVKGKIGRILRTRVEARKVAIGIAKDQIDIEAFQKEVQRLADEWGITQIQAELPMKKQRLLDFMSKERVDRLDLGEYGYVNRIQAVNRHVWIATKADLADMPAATPIPARSLRSILSRELFMRATKRVVDPRAIERMIEDGEITEEQIAPAHYVEMRAPYVKFEKGAT